MAADPAAVLLLNEDLGRNKARRNRAVRHPAVLNRAVPHPHRHPPTSADPADRADHHRHPADLADPVGP